MSNDGQNYKSPTTYEQQLKILRDRNLRIDDPDEAVEILKRINYYRLSAYMLTFKSEDTFKDGVTFRDIYNLYEFDKKLRNLTLSVLETIEIAFRTQIAYLLAHKYGATGYLDASNFIDKQNHEAIIVQLTDALEKSDEKFVEHYKNKYAGVFPIWVAIEVSSFGLLSKLFSNLKNEDKTTISDTYYNNIPHKYLRSWLYAVSTFRNRCAHYGRIYDRPLTIKPMLPRKAKNYNISNSLPFSIYYVIRKLTKDEVGWGSFIADLKSLFIEYDKIDIMKIGFPDDWAFLISK